MTVNEFRAWLEGFMEGWGGGNAPTPEQWAKILAKADELTPYSFESIKRPLEIDPKTWRSNLNQLTTVRTYDSGNSSACVNGHPVGPSD